MENINVGLLPNDGTGDTLREAFIKTQNNFDELLALIEGDAGTVAISGVTGLETILNEIESDLNLLESDINNLTISTSNNIDYISGVTSINTSSITSINSVVTGHTTSISSINNQLNVINLTIANINDTITQLITENIEEAPLDDKQYVRQNGGWTEVVIPENNQITYSAGYDVSGNTITMFSGWTWTINSNEYENTSDVVINIPAASTGNFRIDLIVADTNNTFIRIEGTEDNSNPITPAVPDGTLQATFITVFEGSVDITPTPVGGDVIYKVEKQIFIVDESGIDITLNLFRNTTYKLGTNIQSIANVLYFSSPLVRLDHQIYDGKEYIFYNNQSTDIVFRHNSGLNIPFMLINDEDYTLKPTESIRFILDNNERKFIHIDNVALSLTPTLQEVTDAGNSTSNVIVANNGITTTDTHSNFEIGTNYTSGTRQLSIFIEGDSVDYPSGNTVNISANVGDGISLTSSVSGNTSGVFVNGSDEAVIIAGKSGQFAELKTDLITGGNKEFQFPNANGTLALTSDLSSASSAVWKKSGLSTNANLVNEKIYRQNSVNLIGSTVNFATGPTQADIDNEVLGTSFGHIFGGGTVPFIQLLGNGHNGSAGPNQFISRMVGAPTNLQQMTFSTIKSTNYDSWGDAGRLLWRFQDGYLAPQAKFDIGTDYLRFASYPSSRNDSGDTMNNVLFTTSNGSLRSRPVEHINGKLNITNNTSTAFTSGTLNSTYSSAPLHYQVWCPNITGGGRVYTKIAVGSWVESSITAV